MKHDTRENRITRRSFIARTAAFAATLALGNLGSLAGLGARAARWNAEMELALNVEINQPDGGRRYNRPYVAVWIEDANGNPVRTLSLWVQTTGRGPTWIRDLRRWFRGNADLVDTVSSPTRNPGRYSLVWDGRNDKKALVDQGEYYVNVEAAREHGTYQLIREKVALGEKPFGLSLEGNVEVKGVTLEYRHRG